MVELLIPITMFFALLGGMQRALNHVGPWQFDFISAMRQPLSEIPGQNRCMGVSQSLLAESRVHLPDGDGDHGLALLIQGDISNRITGQSVESFNYRILLGPGVASFELCSTSTLHAGAAMIERPVLVLGEPGSRG